MNNFSPYRPRYALAELIISLFFGALLAAAPDNVHAGTFVFAGETYGVDIITHPIGYSGSGGLLVVEVCIDPASENAAAMEIAVENVSRTLSQRDVAIANVTSNALPAGQIDFESVALHEVGHCLGLAHVNLASESGLSEPQRNFTRSTNGANNAFDLNAGADGIIGSADDIRGDDVNLHWFNADNNPFTIDGIVDTTRYWRDPAALPGNDAFVINADRNVAAALGYPGNESIMQQGTASREIQRSLVADDVATLELAMSGLDGIAGTPDDYDLQVVYGGIKSNCGLNLTFDAANTSFARCVISGSYLNPDHVRITSADAYFNPGFNWHFSATTNADYLLDVSLAGSGAGTVTSNPGGISCGTACSATYASGTSITLTATAASGSTFSGWTGGGCASSPTCNINLDAATVVTATFAADPTGPSSVDLIVGEDHSGAYGNGYGTDVHRLTLPIRFATDASADLLFTVTGYDIDFADEVAVHLNGARIGFLSRGGNNALNGGDVLLLPQSGLQAGDNELELRQKVPGYIWGATDLRISAVAPASCLSGELCLTLDVQDAGEYGNRFGSDQHVRTLRVNFSTDATEDLQFDVTGYDIDFADEVAVSVNGGSLRTHLSVGPNLQRNSGDAIVLPRNVLQNGPNRIEIRQRVSGWVWGVTDLLISRHAAAGCAPHEVCIGIGEQNHGEYGNNYGTDQNPRLVRINFVADATEDLQFRVTGYDIDYADEVAVYLNNGTLLGHLSRGANLQLNSGNTFTIPADALQNGANQLEIRERVNGWTWGVTAIELNRAL